MAEAFAKLPTVSAILDGELVLIDPLPEWHTAIRSLQQVWFRGCRVEAPGVPLRERPKKSKCARWRRANVDRGKLFERPQKPTLTEGKRALIRRREQLRRAQERLRDADLRPAVARELSRNVAILEREIAELERAATSPQ
jgi:hypothetical protein